MNARIAPGGGTSNIATGIPVLDHLLALLARSGGFELALELPPGEGEAEVAAAGRALGESFADVLRADGVAGHGSAGHAGSSPPSRSCFSMLRARLTRLFTVPTSQLQISATLS